MQKIHLSQEHLPFSAVALLLLLAGLWGGNMVSIKLSMYGMPPIISATIRSICASVLVWVYVRSKGYDAFMNPGDRIHAVVVGGLFGVEFLLLYWGTSFTDVSRAIVFLYTQPLWVALFAHFLLPDDRLTWVKAAGLSCAFFGLLLVFKSRSGDLGELYWLGDLMETVAGFLWAATSLYIKKYMSNREISHYQTLFAQLFYSIPILAIGVFLFEMDKSVVIDRLTVGVMLYQTFIVAFFSYLLWFWMVHRYQISVLSAFTFLTPLLGVVLSGIILNEPLPFMLWIGLILVGSGIYLVNRPTIKN